MRFTPALLAVVLAACGSEAAPPSSSASPAGDPIGAWQLVEATVDDRPLDLLEGHPVTAIIEPSSIGGTSACNQYGGRIQLTGDGIRIEEVGGTLMGCAEEVMALEQAYLTALGRVRAMAVTDAQLVLRGPGVDLRYARQAEPPVAELVDTAWTLETLFVGDVASPPGGDPATLELRSDGTFSGSTGCRTFAGRWIENGAQITATELRMGETECPEHLWEQDSHVVSVIGDGFVPSIEGELLTLLDPGGVGLVYRSAE